MKVYKKFQVCEILKSEEAVYIGHPSDRKLRYKSSEILKLNKWSIMHNLIGLEKVVDGPIAYISKIRVGVEEKKVDVDEVKIGNRILPYMKYKHIVFEDEKNEGARSILAILRL